MCFTHRRYVDVGFSQCFPRPRTRKQTARHFRSNTELHVIDAWLIPSGCTSNYSFNIIPLYMLLRNFRDSSIMESLSPFGRYARRHGSISITL
jgi:hypothetical protein